MTNLLHDQFRGCLLGGAIGDALGAPLEFSSRDQILHQYGPTGVSDYQPAYGRLGAITDDTQMTLFTAEGLMRAHVRHLTKGICHVPSVVTRAYLRWLRTQGVEHSFNQNGQDGWLITHPALHSRRSPGLTCLSSLTDLTRIGDSAANDSKGCGGVMRIAPVGMMAATWASNELSDHSLARTFKTGVEIAAITHGHPTGRLPAGFLAALIAALLTGDSLEQAIDRCLKVLVKYLGHEETKAAIDACLDLARSQPNNIDAAQVLGEGWLAHETLSIGLYYALCAADFESGLISAVSHGGDCDSVGSVTGNILGAVHGMEAIPDRWLHPLELREVIEIIADDLANTTNWDADSLNQPYLSRYPGT